MTPMLIPTPESWAAFTGPLAMMASALAIVRSFRGAKREDEKATAARLAAADRRTREIIAIDLLPELAKINSKLDTMQQSFGQGIVRSTIEATANVIYETAVKLNIKKFRLTEDEEGG